MVILGVDKYEDMYLANWLPTRKENDVVVREKIRILYRMLPNVYISHLNIREPNF